jgi:hypothetical protein
LNFLSVFRFTSCAALELIFGLGLARGSLEEVLSGA